MTIKKENRSAAIKFLEEEVGSSLTLPGLLHAIRLGEEMSQAEFAFRLGISKSHLCDIEHGRKIISPERALRFAQILQYSDEQFLRLALQDMVNRLNQRPVWNIELKKTA